MSLYLSIFEWERERESDLEYGMEWVCVCLISAKITICVRIRPVGAECEKASRSVWERVEMVKKIEVWRGIEKKPQQEVANSNRAISPNCLLSEWALSVISKTSFEFSLGQFYSGKRPRLSKFWSSVPILTGKRKMKKKLVLWGPTWFKRWVRGLGDRRTSGQSQEDKWPRGMQNERRFSSTEETCWVQYVWWREHKLNNGNIKELKL